MERYRRDLNWVWTATRPERSHSPSEVSAFLRRVLFCCLGSPHVEASQEFYLKSLECVAFASWEVG